MMSDHDDEHEGHDHPFGFILGGPPPEVVALMRAHKDRQQMAWEDHLRAFDRFLKEAPVEHLVTMNKLMVQLARHSNPGEYANYLEGVFTTTLRLVHGVCSNCGDTHDDLEHEMATTLEAEGLTPIPDTEAPSPGADEEG